MLFGWIEPEASLCRNLGAEAMLGQGEGEGFLQLELQEDDSDDDFQINENAASNP